MVKQNTFAVSAIYDWTQNVRYVNIWSSIAILCGLLVKFAMLNSSEQKPIKSILSHSTRKSKPTNVIGARNYSPMEQTAESIRKKRIRRNSMKLIRLKTRRLLDCRKSMNCCRWVWHNKKLNFIERELELDFCILFKVAAIINYIFTFIVDHYWDFSIINRNKPKVAS